MHTSSVDKFGTNRTQQPTILIVDDAPDNLTLLASMLKDSYKIKVANSGEKALKAVKEHKPDLILLDIIMPGLSGFDVMEELKANPVTRHIPVIFLTSMDGDEDTKYGLSIGAADYIAKPASASIVLARVKAHLENKAAVEALKISKDNLVAETNKLIAELSTQRDVMLLTMAALVDAKYPAASSHIRHVPIYLKILAEKLKSHPRFSSFLTAPVINQLCQWSPLYDVGKIGIPEAVLLKQGTLTIKEYEVMKTHVTIGLQAIEHVEKNLNLPADSLRLVKDIVHYHHERWDGKGYPTGMVGDAIPISARLMALVSVYNAMIFKSEYRDAMSHNQAVQTITAGKGSQFDPDVVDAFTESHTEFRTVRVRHSIGYFS